MFVGIVARAALSSVADECPITFDASPQLTASSCWRKAKSQRPVLTRNYLRYPTASTPRCADSPSVKERRTGILLAPSRAPPARTTSSLSARPHPYLLQGRPVLAHLLLLHRRGSAFQPFPVPFSLFHPYLVPIPYTLAFQAVQSISHFPLPHFTSFFFSQVPTGRCFQPRANPTKPLAFPFSCNRQEPGPSDNSHIQKFPQFPPDPSLLLLLWYHESKSRLSSRVRLQPASDQRCDVFLLARRLSTLLLRFGSQQVDSHAYATLATPGTLTLRWGGHPCRLSLPLPLPRLPVGA